MQKKTAIKVAKKSVKRVRETPKLYKVSVFFNDQVSKFSTDDLATSLMEIKPMCLKTRVLFTIEKEGKTCERMLLLNAAKLMWRNKLAMEAFTSRLIFK